MIKFFFFITVLSVDDFCMDSACMVGHTPQWRCRRTVENRSAYTYIINDRTKVKNRRNGSDFKRKRN